MQEKTQDTSNVQEEQQSRMAPPPYPGPPPENQETPPPVTVQPQVGFMSPQMGVGTQGTMFVGAPGTMSTVGQPGTMTAIAPGFIMLQQMVPQSTPFHCKSCNQQIVTNVKRKPTFKTHFFALAFCLVCCIPCAIIPYCMEPCRQADHYCPNCDSFIGSYVP